MSRLVVGGELRIFRFSFEASCQRERRLALMEDGSLCAFPSLHGEQCGHQFGSLISFDYLIVRVRSVCSLSKALK